MSLAKTFHTQSIKSTKATYCAALQCGLYRETRAPDCHFCFATAYDNILQLPMDNNIFTDICRVCFEQKTLKLITFKICFVFEIQIQELSQTYSKRKIKTLDYQTSERCFCC